MKRQLFILLINFVLISCSDSSANFNQETIARDYQNKLAQNKHGRLPDSAIYDGAFNEGRFHGKGKLVWRNGDMYEGEFKEGLMHGKGKHILPELLVYEGEFSEGLWEGQGTVKYNNDVSYSGLFKQGYYNGIGKFVDRDGTIFEGEFRNDRLHGKGKIIYLGGGAYEGDVADWRMHGKGVYKVGAVTYSGEFRDGSQEGTGEIIYENGDHYKGKIVSWSPDGSGEYFYKNGDYYNGEYEEGVKHGRGELRYKNNDIYIGSFESDYRHGMGKLTSKEKSGDKKIQNGWWEYDSFIGKKPKDTSRKGIMARVMERIKSYGRKKVDAEGIFYRQPKLLETSLGEIKVSDPKKIDLYFVGFAAYGSQDVFMKETRYAKKLFDKEFSTASRSSVLINNHDVSNVQPIASITNLNLMLADVGRKMDNNQDVLFLYLTSHGSKKKGLDVSLRGLPLNDLPPKKLDKMLDDSGIKWRVIVVSACYSGGFVDQLKDEYTLIMTSSRKDRKSFGCSDEAEFTYFGRALFKHAIPDTKSFLEAFNKANTLVRDWEKKEKYKHSEPQIWHSDKVLAHLSKWRESIAVNSKLARN